jgi:hypothetical protein
LLAVSNDSRYIVALTSEPEYKLVYFDIRSNKEDLPSTVLGIPITKIAMSKDNRNIISLSGENYFKLIRVQEDLFIYTAETIKRLD